ncbi:sigma-70 family RNA polymerase sigma factor [bacterium]|nr:sigma-70 family RNA polymerase sigma factor [bacterium]
MGLSETTNVELILRLADTQDQFAWAEFVKLYEPLLFNTARKLGLSQNDAVDAVQEVFVHLGKVIAQWKPTGRPGAFRGWLVRVARNQMLALIQRTTMLKAESAGNGANEFALANSDDSQQSTYFNIEFRRTVFLYVVRKIRDSFSEKTWQAFWFTYMDQRSPIEVAAELDLTTGAVYIARSRVMSRLQSEIKLLVDEEWASLMAADMSSDPSVTLSIIRNCSTGNDGESLESDPAEGRSEPNDEDETESGTK